MKKIIINIFVVLISLHLPAQTKSDFYLNHPCEINISIYNTIGQKILFLFEGKKRTGLHTLSFNAEGLFSGVYFYVFPNKGFHLTKKMLYVR